MFCPKFYHNDESLEKFTIMSDTYLGQIFYAGIHGWLEAIFDKQV